jgi:hypothetical protein
MTHKSCRATDIMLKLLPPEEFWEKTCMEDENVPDVNIIN